MCGGDGGRLLRAPKGAGRGPQCLRACAAGCRREPSTPSQRGRRSMATHAGGAVSRIPAFSAYLLEEAKVAVVPGGPFGGDRPHPSVLRHLPRSESRGLRAWPMPWPVRAPLSPHARPRKRFQSLSDQQLLESLKRPAIAAREAVDECLRRESVWNPTSDGSSQTSPGRSRCPSGGAVPRDYILGASESPSAVGPLLTSLRWADAFDCDWVAEDLPAFSASSARGLDPWTRCFRDETAGWGAGRSRSALPDGGGVAESACAAVISRPSLC